MERNLISKSDRLRLKNLGEKVATYRKLADRPSKILASMAHISEDELEAIERGHNKNLRIATILRLAEALGISYCDLFETDNEKYYTNIHDDVAMAYILKKCREYRYTKLAEKQDINRMSFTNWQTRNYIPSPFILGNLITFLKITPVDLESQEPIKAKVVKEEPVKSIDMMSQVIDACNMYKNIETMRAQLDEIITKAQELRKMLGGEQNGQTAGTGFTVHE